MAPVRYQKPEGFSSSSSPPASKNNNNDHEPRISSASTASSGSSPQRHEDVVALADVHIADRYGFFIKMQNAVGRNPSREFWTSLGDEFQGLKALLEEPGNEESDDDQETPLTPGTIDFTTRKSSSTFIFNNNHDSVEFLSNSYPTLEQRKLLLDIYFENVNPVLMMSHKPTAYAHMAAARELSDPSTGRLLFPSLEAINFACYFCAVTSMTDEECTMRLGESRDVLVNRYKRGTEIALGEADFLNSMELVTLKAFAVYIVSVVFLCSVKWS